MSESIFDGMKMSGLLGARCVLFCGVLMLGGCASFEESGLPGSAASMARNQIMLVRKSPPSFGFSRLQAHVRAHPELEGFLKARPIPDFLAETSDELRTYFILYFLSKKQAYAFRTQPEDQASLEASGPYPITVGEQQTLEDFRAQLLE
jgi:hypothetical protein